MESLEEDITAVEAAANPSSRTVPTQRGADVMLERGQKTKEFDRVEETPPIVTAIPHPTQVLTATADTLASHKRPRATTQKSSIHKPFRSPLRFIGHPSDQPASGPSARNSPSEIFAPKASSLGSQLGVQGLTDKLATSSIPTSSSISKKPSLGVRRPFRSPLLRDQRASRNPNDACARLIQIQSLQTKIAELQSSIRKGQRVIQQQETNDTPLEDLIDKWRKASQEGAKVLLEKFIAQEQMFGGDTWGDSTHSSRSRQSFCFGSDSWGYGKDSFYDRRPSLSELNPEQMEAMEERMETQDVQLDLPTVEEALMSKLQPETETTRAPTRMQKLLMGLGIDPALLEYDPEQDTFATE
ncbi:MAG: hypothetical protein J3Q66DRAFT_327355 [Benniella sp.]|nr:MAG: hypothetical protein J3Q66DRAFT_327355 [Benniella sp.]